MKVDLPASKDSLIMIVLATPVERVAGIIYVNLFTTIKQGDAQVLAVDLDCIKSSISIAGVFALDILSISQTLHFYTK